MPLTEVDVKRLREAGFDSAEFSVEVDGEVRLRNVGGSCFFLRDGRCAAYEARPSGCRLYPLVYEVASHKFVLDPLCPHGSEFKPTREEKDALRSLIGRVERERARRLRARRRPRGNPASQA
jgi:hypothetical protein